jgi:hypothetical protein
MGYYDEALCHSRGEWKKHKYIRKEGKKYYYDRTVHDEESNTTWDYYIDPDTGEQIQVNRDYHPDRYSIDDFMSDMKELYGKRTLLSREEIEEAHNNVDPEPKKEEEKKYYAKHSEEDDDHLEHHGILGQKWGVRRFQNYDGSLTGAGKNRVASKRVKGHQFDDKSGISHNRRSETVQSLITSIVSTAALTGVNAATLSVGFVIPHAIAATPIAAIATAYNAGKLISGDINTAKGKAKEKKFKEEREQNPIDKKTGFHKKTKEMSASEDMERINPNFKNWDENTKNNCVLCTMSMELRRRGYDVQAKPATSGYAGNALVKDWFLGAKPKVSDGSFTDDEIRTRLKEAQKYGDASMLKISKDRQKKMIESTISEVQKQPDGARGQITVKWDGSLSGHSIFYANEGGKMVIYDTQANERYEGDKAITKYLSRVSQVNVTRLDNTTLNTKYIKEVAE